MDRGFHALVLRRRIELEEWVPLQSVHVRYESALLQLADIILGKISGGTKTEPVTALLFLLVLLALFAPPSEELWPYSPLTSAVCIASKLNARFANFIHWLTLFASFIIDDKTNILNINLGFSIEAFPVEIFLFHRRQHHSN